MLPTSTVNITGLRTWRRGSSFLNASNIARRTMGGSNRGRAFTDAGMLSNPKFQDPNSKNQIPRIKFQESDQRAGQFDWFLEIGSSSYLFHFAIICKCSTIGPSAKAGTKVKAPTSTTVHANQVTKSGVCVGKVPAPGGVYFLRASDPATARVGMISQ